MLLLTFKKDWADEFDCEGFAFISEEQWEYKKKEAEECEFPREVYFGTNECFKFKSAKNFINSFKLKSIFDEDVNKLKKLFDMNQHENLFGICPYEGCEGNASNEFYTKHGYCPD